MQLLFTMPVLHHDDLPLIDLVGDLLDVKNTSRRRQPLVTRCY